ncbi:MAG: metallophosphoesterase [Pirellulales bacterium]
MSRIPPLTVSNENVARLGVSSDSHDQLDRVRTAVEMLQSQQADAIIHCGDITRPEILAACSVLSVYFGFGNHDCDVVPDLRQAAIATGARPARIAG